MDKWLREFPVVRPMDEAFKLDHPIPAAIGCNCPEHPSYPLVWAVHKGQPDQGWCRRGQHLVPLSND